MVTSFLRNTMEQAIGVDYNINKTLKIVIILAWQ